MTVVEISNENGEVGKHFMFSAEEFTKMVGYDKWYGQKFIIVQSGSQSWDGKVEVWKEGNTSVGKKHVSPADGDWKVNDTIELKGCSNPGKIISFHYQIISYFLFDLKVRNKSSSYSMMNMKI